MCGIIGYKGKRIAQEIVVEGLKKLEYRGYDSWGVASASNDNLQLIKNIGKISDVHIEDFGLLESHTGIGHTRWATTGKVNEQNAHPHYSSDKTFALVQNGIVENYQELRDELIRKGHKFFTETDTEVIVRLIEEELKNSKDLKIATMDAFNLLEGRNSIVLLENNSRIIAIKNGSPLIIGVGEEEYFITSDPSPILDYTKKLIFLNDNEGVVIDQEYEIYNTTSKIIVKKEVETIDWELEQARKGAFPHFMIKEILEQKHTIAQSLVQDNNLIQKVAGEINNAVGVYMVGCGTAGKVCLTGTYAFSKIAKKHINFAFGSEFPNYHDFITDKTLLIVVSQSGETADTLEAMKIVKEKGGKIISLVNVMGSTIMRQSDYSFLLNVGPEIAVCSTKATTAQIALMFLLAFASVNKHEEGSKILKNTANEISKILDEKSLKKLDELAFKLKDSLDMYVIGRGMNYPMALEAAIKIQEVSYIHAEGFAGGELKHGPIALIEEGSPVFGFVANDETKHDMISNLLEVKSRGAFIIGVSPEDNEVFDIHIKVPEVGLESPIVNIVPIQLLSYYLAVHKGLDPDKPRNLAKSVTVR